MTGVGAGVMAGSCSEGEMVGTSDCTTFGNGASNSCNGGGAPTESCSSGYSPYMRGVGCRNGETANVCDAGITASGAQGSCTSGETPSTVCSEGIGGSSNYCDKQGLSDSTGCLDGPSQIPFS